MTRKYASPETLAFVIEEYFNTCDLKPIMYMDSNDREVPLLDSKGNPVMASNPPTVSGLARYLGFKSRQSMYDYEHSDDECAGEISAAKLRIEEYHEKILTTKERCTGSIFWLKNHNWKDERTLSGGSPFAVVNVNMTSEEEEEFKKNLVVFFGTHEG